MALDVAQDGSVVVLDQANGRLQVWAPDGQVREIALPQGQFQDISLDGQGGVVLLDRQGAGAVVALGLADGRTRWSLRPLAPAIPQPAALTGLFARADGVWLEVAHAEWVRLCDLQGQPGPARSLPGRPTQDGLRTLRAERLTAHSASVTASAPSGDAFHVEVGFALPLRSLRALEATAQGRSVLVAAQWQEAAPGQVSGQRLTAVTLDSAGKEVGRHELTPPGSADEQFRPIRLGADGWLYHLRCGEQGALVERVQP